MPSNPRSLHRIRDIAPPATAEKKKPSSADATKGTVPKSSKRKVGFSFLSLFFVLILGGGIAGFLLLHFVFARAQVLLYPHTREVTVQEQLQANKSTLPLQILSEEKELTRLFKASGKAKKETKAEGVIRVFNEYSPLPRKLVANTRFLSQEGKLFRSLEAITIPGFSQEGGNVVPGFIDVKVQAAEAGEEYNIGSSNFSLPGLFGGPSYTSIYGKSLGEMQGGSIQETSVVTSEDLVNARDTLVEDLERHLTELLLARVTEDLVLLEEKVSSEVKEAFSPVKPGALLDQFNFSVKMKATALVFSKEDLVTISKNLLGSHMEEQEVLDPEGLHVEFLNSQVRATPPGISFTAVISGRVFQSIDPTQVKAQLLGKSKEEAVRILEGMPGLETSRVKLWPPWLRNFPSDENKIHTSFVID